MLLITLEKPGTARLTGKWDARMYGLLTQLPGFKKWQNRDLLLETSAANLKHIGTFLHDCVQWDPSMHARLAEVAAMDREIERVRSGEYLPEEATAFEFPLKPFDHQLKAFNLSRKSKEFALFLEMGCGKSAILLWTAADLWRSGEIDTLIIFSPKGVNFQWVEEQVPLHLPKFVNHKTFIYQAGGKIKQELEKFLKETPPETLKIISFNTDALSSDSGRALVQMVLSRSKALMAVDESSKIKSPGALRTKAAIKFGKMAAYRRILSGSPVTRGIEDLYSQLRFLNEDCLGFRSFYSFRDHFCIMGGFQQRVITGYKHQDEIQERLAGIAFIVKKEDCLDLPEKQYVIREIELGTEQRKLYDQLRDELYIELEGETITVALAIVKLLRLQQISNGFISDNDNIQELAGSNPRLEALKDICEQTDGKIIIWARFRHDINLIMKELGKAAVRYDGATDTKQRIENIKLFKEDPSVRFFVGNPQAGGMGLNLTVATTVVYFSNSFDADIRWQSEDRAHRIGQTSRVTYIDIVARNTVDRQLLSSLRRKKNIADDVMSLRALLSPADHLQ